MNERRAEKNNVVQKPNLFELLKPYKGMIILLVIFTLLGNGANLVIPLIISNGITALKEGSLVFRTIIVHFIIAACIIFIFTYLQSIVQTISSEKVARDLRRKVSDKISTQSYSFIQKSNPSKLLTNLTSDMDSVKMFVSHAVSSIISSVFIIGGTSILLLTINWKLALAVLTIIPLIAFTFFMVFKRVKVLFVKARDVIDRLNRVINESIIGSAIIRVLNSQQTEYRKFMAASSEAKNIGVAIVTLFATLIPIIMFVSNIATLTVLALGGGFVINSGMSIADFAAFNSYISILIFPVMVIGFMSNVIAEATASYARINKVLKAPEIKDTGILTQTLSGNIEFKGVGISYNGKPALRDISFSVSSGNRVALIGPTAAGKTQLLYLLTGLLKPDSGQILFDGHPIDDFNKEFFYNQIGFVFQDSIMFNMSLRENIAFNNTVTGESLDKAIETAELKDFIENLPNKLDTVISERGTSLSGGQKQRIMLARALALNPKILLLDDFTSRVDRQTENKIICNVLSNYPDITLISITQKIAPVKDYEQIILLMEGELIATGKHTELLSNCPEYIQIYNSQLSTSHYELQS